MMTLAEELGLVCGDGIDQSRLVLRQAPSFKQPPAIFRQAFESEPTRMPSQTALEERPLGGRHPDISKADLLSEVVNDKGYRTVRVRQHDRLAALTLPSAKKRRFSSPA
jgi:hypothetical protein